MNRDCLLSWPLASIGNIVIRVCKIKDKLIRTKTYGGLKEVEITKKDGGIRKLGIPTWWCTVKQKSRHVMYWR